MWRRVICEHAITWINDLPVTPFDDDEGRLVYLDNVKKCSFNMRQTVFKPGSFNAYIKMKIFGYFAILSLAQVKYHFKDILVILKFCQNLKFHWKIL